MGSYREILWENASAAEIAVAKHCAPTKEGFVRYQALELLCAGYARAEVARISGRSGRTIRNWLQSFREQGLDGLAIKSRTGRPRRIDADKFRTEYVPLILEPERAGESHWTALKFHGHLRDKFREKLGYSTLARYLGENDMALRYPRRWPERQEQDKRQEFLKKLRKLAADRRNSVWFCDEAGFEGDPRPRRVWVKKGSKPKLPYLGDHIRHNVIGAVNPKRGDFFSLVVPHSDKEVFQVFLNELAKHTAKTEPNKQTILVLDNASWHRHSELKWHHITPCFLPAYSPDFNPIEEIWRVLKERFFTNWIAKSIGQLVDRICQAITSLLKDDVASISSMTHLVRK